MIEVDGLRFSYPGSDAETLKGIGFSVREGEIFGFLGPSGAGKSTTQKIMIGLLQGYEGRYSIMGRPAAEWNRELYEHIGVAFEQPNLYARFTARENLAYFASLYRDRPEPPLELLERIGLADAVDRRVETYSKGMQTRLNLVRALQHDPRILFLDEPTDGLDPANARLVMDLILERRRRGTTILVTTHKMRVAEELCDNLGFIVDGEVSRIAPPRQLKLEYGERVVTLEYYERGEVRQEGFPLDGIGRNPRFLELLAGLDDGSLRRIHSGEATLEQVFMAVTGKRLV